MGVLTDQFNKIIGDLYSAIGTAIDTTMFDGLVDALGESAEELVYSYPNKSAYFAASRRGTIAARTNMVNISSALTLKLRDDAVMQGGMAGEVRWVEAGIKQDGAGARPFMEEGLQKYAAGRASEDLVTALLAAGFDAHVG